MLECFIVYVLQYRMEYMPLFVHVFVHAFLFLAQVPFLVEGSGRLCLRKIWLTTCCLIGCVFHLDLQYWVHTHRCFHAAGSQVLHLRLNKIHRCMEISKPEHESVLEIMKPVSDSQAYLFHLCSARSKVCMIFIPFQFTNWYSCINQSGLTFISNLLSCICADEHSFPNMISSYPCHFKTSIVGMLDPRAVWFALTCDIDNLFVGLLGAGNLGLIFRVKCPLSWLCNPSIMAVALKAACLSWGRGLIHTDATGPAFWFS